MTKRFLAVVALMVAVVFASSIVAQAADVTFGGQLRPRYEYFTNNDFDTDTDSTQMINTRIRLNTKVKVDDNIGAFIQFQARGVFGAGTGGGIPDGTTSGSRNAAIPADDVIDVGLHQAYFTVKNLMSAPVNLKIGRQEVILDGHRLFGNTGWTQGAQSADAIRLDHKHGDSSTISYIYIKAIEALGTAPFRVGGNSAGAPTNLGGAGVGGLLGQGGCPRGGGFGGGDNNDSCDRDDHVLWANFKGMIPDGQLSGYFVYTNDQSWNQTIAGGGSVDNDMYTVGARVAGGAGGLSYRFEGYYQFGDADGISSVHPIVAMGGAGAGVSRAAYMLAARVGFTAKDAPMKPSVTLWYDHLSGTSLGNAQSGDWKTFDTLYDTGHKYYGFMDTYLNATGADTTFLGLQDIAVKTKISPMANLAFKADFHYFRTAAEQTTLGKELDLTLVHKYSSNLKIVAGYSFYAANDAFGAVNRRVVTAAGPGDFDDFTHWGYLMMDLTF